MELRDTVDNMLSSDYKDRFYAEYDQLSIRINKLKELLTKYKNETLDFTPKCSYALLTYQLETMMVYRYILTARAVKEGIDVLGGDRRAGKNVSTNSN